MLYGLSCAPANVRFPPTPDIRRFRDSASSRIDKLVILNLGSRCKVRRLNPITAHQMKHGATAREEIVSDDAPVAPPPD
jgi:hypothetical protein